MYQLAALILVLACSGCTKEQAVQARPAIELGLDLATQACIAAHPDMADFCRLGDSSLDLLLKHFMAMQAAKPGALQIDPTKLDREGKVRLLSRILDQ